MHFKLELAVVLVSILDSRSVKWGENVPN